MRDAANRPTGDRAVSVERTDRLDGSVAVAVRHLLNDAFRESYHDTDWQHALGGVHVVVRAADDVVAHAAVVSRLLRIDGSSRKVAYVEAVATRADRQGEGLGRLAMHEVACIIADHHGLGVLSTGAHGFYERLGWQRWQGPSWVRAGDGVRRRTPDEDDGLMALVTGAAGHVSLESAIECDEREGDDW